MEIYKRKNVLIGRVTGLKSVVIFRTVFWERTDCRKLSSSLFRQVVDQVSCLET